VRAAEDYTRFLDGGAPHLQTHRERRHREVPHFSRPDLLERRLEARLRRRKGHFGQDFVEANDVRLQPPIDHDA
jgi:hypothetical protein